MIACGNEIGDFSDILGKVMQSRFCGYCRWILYGSLLLLIVSCQTETADQGQVLAPQATVEESQPSETEQPVEPYHADRTFVDTGVVGYEKIVVKPEDLGWPSVSYLFTHALESFAAPSAKESYRSDLSPFYNPVDHKTGALQVHDPFGVTQFLDVFESEEDALDYFEYFTQGPWIESEYPSNFAPQLENIRFECRPTGDGYTSCNVVMKYGRFLTNAGMYIGENKTTPQDWENLLVAMQGRLIAFVEEEKQNQ